jgi:DNA-3-methyladenine glycosylase I
MPSPDLLIGDDGVFRCGWVGTDTDYIRYHDTEWSVPLVGDQKLFEKLSLEAFQAGLSWITILKRRPGFRDAFSGFDIDTVATLTEADIDRLVSDQRIIRNRAKIQATITNAQIVHAMVASSPGAFHDLVWSFQPAGDTRPRPQRLADVPAVTEESTRLSTTLKSMGFSFVGPTTMYALMQSAGLVDDHLEGCWRSA